ncbi:ABC transporter permease subunit [Inquilinus limosus]|uniref:ABC transporter permease subunit n=1 Tax=Inquilinus limosus TaxID=171674 RepID=UPI00041F7262
MSLFELIGLGPQGWGRAVAAGAAMTLLVAALGFALGLLWGAAAAAARLSGVTPLRWLSAVYTTVVRGVPELLVLYLLFFGGGALFRAVGEAFGYGGAASADAFGAGVVAIGIISGAYSGEVIRGAVRAIPPGQIEAARAFGMSPAQRLRLVVLPQLLRYALPSLGNVWQMTLKDTALISVTGLVELMRTTEIAAGSTRLPFVFYTLAILVFLGFTALSNAAFHWAEQRFNRGIVRGRPA